MRTIKLISAFIGIALTVLSCGGGKETELAKLKKQQVVLDEKIKNLENNKNPVAVDPLDPAKFRFVGITDVKTNAFDHYIRVQGKLDGDQNAAVYADVPGTVTFKYADVGQNVKRGQVLAQIDDRQYRSQLESLETQYNLTSDLYEKQKRLWDQKIGSEVQYMQSKTAKESLDQQITSLKEQVEKFKIKSPVDGTIEECNIKAGSVVSPDPHSPAYRVVGLRSLKITAEVSEAYAARVQAGDKIKVLFPDINRQIDAKIDFVSRYINPVNRTFIIESRIANRFPEMKANMIAIVQINDYHSENSIQIPMNVILTDNGGSYVYVVRKKDEYDGAFKQPVVIGNTYNGVAEILNGLGVNDKVVTAGFQELIDGEYIRFDKKL
jgi:RND family efflux transporter MFP subunit